MARFARIVVPDVPCHVTHRGNRRDDVFFNDEDREVYKEWLGEYAEQYGLEIWAYCLMTNHVHLLVLPQDEQSLAKTIGRTHMRYARRVNRRQKWSGHLWANRYYSTPLDEEHLWAAAKYIELNPVRARLVRRAENYPWSSAPAHVFREEDPLLSPSRPFTDRRRVRDWSAWLKQGLDDDLLMTLRQNTRTGRPSGSDRFIDRLERLLDRLLRPQKRGPKPRDE